jgi:hypothetical protein
MRREWASFAGIFIVTNLGLLAVGATLAVLPHYVKDSLDGSDLEVGIVERVRLHRIVCRPIAATSRTRGRKPTLIVGALPLRSPVFSTSSRQGSGLIVARFFLGAGEERCSRQARPGTSTWRPRSAAAG